MFPLTLDEPVLSSSICNTYCFCSILGICKGMFHSILILFISLQVIIFAKITGIIIYDKNDAISNSLNTIFFHNENLPFIASFFISIVSLLIPR